ncbi:MAG: hypothetical protein KF893_24385 [Caldilineaceae bacterium]|nr:hypothetical protein [Caldilineaceae bacterium]
MRRPIMMAIIKLCGEAVLFSLFAGIVIGIIGNVSKWETSREYSNAFFIAGGLLIIAGAWSRLGAGQEWILFQRLSAESFRGMSANERASFIVEASSSVHLLMLGLLSGILLILFSVFVIKLF